ncbi:hypothetical protein JNUCC0626_32255 [Lentzea sp. JNUCC 0626]|uniref:hypothetical protein n=1 Tax=Lentzea sp. JNUCC 0626 TaxID=3367513 RepID=UPI0037478552
MADAGDVSSWVAAGIAALAAVVASWQTVQARGARRAAEVQADQARGSRLAAEKQAAAAEAQVAIMRAERDGRDAPTFAVSAVDVHPEEASYFAIRVSLTLERGRALDSVAVTASGERVNENALHRSTDPDIQGGWGSELVFEDVRQGKHLVFYMSADRGYVGSTVNIDLNCRERDGDRSWSCHYTCTIDEPPRSRSSKASFI